MYIALYILGYLKLCITEKEAEKKDTELSPFQHRENKEAMCLNVTIGK
jgi:hypothetical protein